MFPGHLSRVELMPAGDDVCADGLNEIGFSPCDQYAASVVQNCYSLFNSGYNFSKEKNYDLYYLCKYFCPPLK